MNSFDDLRGFDRIYLGSPYRKFPHGIGMAARQVAKIAARLTMAGLPVYSPIAHGHMMSVYGGIHPSANELWEKINKPWMLVCDALLVAKMESWEISDGLKEEIDFFKMWGKPTYYIDPVSLLVSNAA